MKLCLRVLLGLTLAIGGIFSAYAQSPREQLKQMVDELKKDPENVELRKRLIELGQAIRPGPAIPMEAERFEGRAQFLFKSAKSVNEYLESAREYLKAIDAAPWIPGYYVDLCSILERAERPKEALVACHLYFASAPSGTDAARARRQAAGLELAIERMSERMFKLRSRQKNGAYRGSTTRIYSRGAVVAGFSDNTGVFNDVSVSIMTIYDGPPRNVVVVNYKANDKSFSLNYELSGSMIGNYSPPFEIRIDGQQVVVGGVNVIRTTIDELFRKRDESLRNETAIVKSGGQFFVARFQGAMLGKTAGWIFYESDCEGTVRDGIGRTLPNRFVPEDKERLDVFDIKGYEVPDDPCSLSEGSLSWLTKLASGSSQAWFSAMAYSFEQVGKGSFKDFTGRQGEFKVSIPNGWYVVSANDDDGFTYYVFADTFYGFADETQPRRKLILLWYRIYRPNRLPGGYLEMFSDGEDYARQIMRLRMGESKIIEKKSQIKVEDREFISFTGQVESESESISCRRPIKELCAPGVQRYAISGQVGGFYVLIGIAPILTDEASAEYFKEFVRTFIPLKAGPQGPEVKPIK